MCFCMPDIGSLNGSCGRISCNPPGKPTLSKTVEDMMWAKISKIPAAVILPVGEAVNHPAHYGGDTPYESIKVIEAWGLGFNLGNAVKYISRADKKGNRGQDLQKALWYLIREINLAEGAKP